MRAAQDFDAFYEERQRRAHADAETGPILVLTVDGKGVVMRPEDLRAATRRAAAERARTFTARLERGRRLHASVAALTRLTWHSSRKTGTIRTESHTTK
jgi:hypothetical protein